MLFNSKEFIAWFLPITVIGFFLLGTRRFERAAVAWLILASLFYYAWWRTEYVALLMFSIAFNYWVGLRLSANAKRALLASAIAVNLLLLGYYKYSLFFVENINALFGTSFWMAAILLPIGISFFTFQQIAYLVDAYDGVAKEQNFLNYCLFVTFFPQLIAGPIVHHKEMLPQLRRAETFRPHLDNLCVGLTIFAIGLFKKVGLADNVAIYADQVFDAAATGGSVGFLEAWGGALAFTLQIYFDFSGYSDMAIGLARLFGIRLPINFDSPLKAASIIDFWARWHMTLTRFLTSYVYNPITLALTRRRMAAGKPVLRRGAVKPEVFLALIAFPTLTTMFLSGLWHGAGYQFVVWGLLHGLYLTINHAWRMLCHTAGLTKSALGPPLRPVGVILTFTAVVFSLVYFRADSVSHANVLIGAMFGQNGFVFPTAFQAWLWDLSPAFAGVFEFARLPLIDEAEVLHLALLLAIVWFFPNTQQWVLASFDVTGRKSGEDAERFSPVRPFVGLGSRLMLWRPTPLNAVVVGGLFTASLLGVLSEAPSRFLYFNF